VRWSSRGSSPRLRSAGIGTSAPPRGSSTWRTLSITAWNIGDPTRRFHSLILSSCWRMRVDLDLKFHAVRRTIRDDTLKYFESQYLSVLRTFRPSIIHFCARFDPVSVNQGNIQIITWRDNYRENYQFIDSCALLSDPVPVGFLYSCHNYLIHTHLADLWYLFSFFSFLFFFFFIVLKLFTLLVDYIKLNLICWCDGGHFY